MIYKFNTSEQRSNIMKKIKSKNTKPEISFRKTLWNAGIRYRTNNRSIIGNPDIAIKKYKLAIFIDGEFWHGYNWNKKKEKIQSNRDYWIPKIERNIKRDKQVTKQLKKEGWKVFRFWDSQIKKETKECLKKVINEIQLRKNENN